MTPERLNFAGCRSHVEARALFRAWIARITQDRHRELVTSLLTNDSLDEAALDDAITAAVAQRDAAFDTVMQRFEQVLDDLAPSPGAGPSGGEG